MKEIRYAASLLVFLGLGYLLYCGFLVVQQFILQVGLVVVVAITLSFVAVTAVVTHGVWRAFAVAERVEEMKGSKRVTTTRKKAE